MYKKYLILDGKSQAEKDLMFISKLMGETSFGSSLKEKASSMKNHRVYRFENGYGVSVLKGFFTFGSWEIAEIKFKGDAPKRRIPKKKRLKEKWKKQFLQYEIIGEINRVSTEEDINREFLKIRNRS